ncbi:MAG: cell wall-binding repeat-containing protein [Terrimesophilobacter sp.]
MLQIRSAMPSQRQTLRRVIAVVSAALMVAVGLVVATPAGEVQALNVSSFDPGNIITDSNFYNANAMSEAEIQTFLNAKIGTCTNGRCLNVLTQTTYSRPADRTVCAAYTGDVNEPASRVIFKVQQACGISAKVILATLQKEMGLVTSKAPSEWALAHALGYACSDSSPCDSTQSGFYNQIYKGAWQFKRYSTPDVFGGFWAGQTRAIQFHPNTSCGTLTVKIANRATAALYAYTPYTPNAAAIAATPGLGNGCSSYGNRNFWYFYSSWFGSPTDITPVGVAVNRIGVADRFDTAVMISQQSFPTTAPIVYISNGLDFPDALSAAPAAAMGAGPLLLVTPTQIPAQVKAEIIRLAPAKIVVTGGSGVVSDSVFTKLSALAPAVVRVGGADRYETSRMVAAASFPAATTTTAFVSMGSMFPDALSASAAAGSLSAPVILVNGLDTQVDKATSDLLQVLGVTKVFITGGTAVVTPGLEASLALVPGVTNVTRYGGADRYLVSSATNRATFTTSTQAYVASGVSFPDALAGAAVAGMNKVPLYITPTSCIYTPVLEDFLNFGVTTMTILGGSGVIDSGVSTFKNCQ